MTELEFGFGMLWDSAPDGEHLVVFRDLVGLVPDGWADPDSDRVMAFRNEVVVRAAVKRVTARRYTAAVAEGAQTVDLESVVAENERVSFEDLMVTALTAPVRRRAEEVIVASGAGREGVERLFRDDHTVAVGREALVGDLTARLIAGDRVVLVGESGTGKSTILCAVEESLHGTESVTVVSVLLGASGTGVSGRDVVLRLVEQLQPLIGHELSAPTDADEDAFIQWWRDVLTEAQTVIGGRLVVVVDALDALADDRARSDVWPARVVPPSIGLLCSTTSPDQAAVLEGVGGDRIDVGELSPATAVEAARSWAGQTGRALPASVLAIIGTAPRSPLWVRLAVDLLADLDAGDFTSIAAAPDQASAIEGLLLQGARRLPSDAADLAGVFLDRVADRIGEGPAELLLGALATARSGLAPVDLAVLLPDDPDSSLKVAVLQRVLGDQLRSTDAAGRLTFAHTIVQQHAASRVGTDVHTRIVDVLAGDTVWDDTNALDVIWHTVSASTETGEPASGSLVGVLARAANHRPHGGDLVLMRALDAYPGPGIALIDRLDRSMLSDEGMAFFLEAPRAVDRRYLRPAARVDLSLAVLDLALAGETGTRDRQAAAACNNLGADNLVVGDLDGAGGAFDRALKFARRLMTEQPGSEQAKSDLGVALNGIGDVREARGDLEGAQAAFEETLELRRGLVRAEPDLAQARRELSVALNRVGAVRRVRGDADGALSAYQESLELARGLALAQPASVQAQSDLVVALNRIGGVRQASGDLDGAQAAFEEMLVLDRALVSVQPGSVRARHDLGVALGWIGSVRRSRGDLEGALAAFEEALELFRELAQAQPGSVGAVEAVVSALTNIAIVQRERGDSAAARAMIEEAVLLAGDSYAAHPDVAVAKSDLASAMSILAEILDGLGDVDGAERVRAEAAALEGP
ncbi:MAG TPA: hypothetical protein PK331_16870 [Gordonia sp. (in: high G+C Gram-positive bacteria)]|uniref:hypothetical protein n=1 Tax=Gordonia sp. (in: high G+C Gram-positive bacteria) TaxID=84139 RepID=UPI000F9EC106|nr:hypothetical protein [Gordonia sp. (in: high G+C Gram-positive bacteria)]RUP40109.1 MAG: tetratricopeptide repeat protein [Gordonia sp. (in: high G+C Gram-positive bacteria)]HNP58231.1 hypothetical protein [Gordonia sp. (in: high G+C Gram-positive bacteria)]HRC52581.1 hypothetical protein [Gordonia sp. (in: high G+C Gram-positive bacteria)]